MPVPEETSPPQRRRSEFDKTRMPSKTRRIGLPLALGLLFVIVAIGWVILLLQ